jgi:predicted flavoprotein YhiN
MTDRAIAKLIKVNPNTMTNWKKNKPELYQLIRLGISKKTFKNIPKSKKRIELLMSELFGFSTQSYFNWKKEAHTKRKIISLLEKYFTKEDLEEFLETGEIQKQELVKDLSHDELKKLIDLKNIIKEIM